MTLGCKILCKLSDVLHEKQFQSNPQNVRADPKARPDRYKSNSTLLYSVTHPSLPQQPGGTGNRWLPPERQVEDAQNDQEVDGFLRAAVKPPPDSSALDRLLTANSREDLQAMCGKRRINAKHLNRMSMAQSILFHDACCGSAGAPSRGGGRAASGKVLCAVDCSTGVQCSADDALFVGEPGPARTSGRADERDVGADEPHVGEVLLRGLSWLWILRRGHADADR